MFLDGLLKALRAPLDAIRGKRMDIDQIKGGIKIDIDRVKGNINEYKDAAGGAAAKAQGAQAQAANMQQQAAQKKGKMGFFSRKKACPSCGQKLHPSWDQCPFCGYSEHGPPPEAAAAAPSAPQPKARTMALDMNAAVSTGPVTSQVGWLVGVDGPQAGELFQIKGRVIVGSKDDCDVIIKDPSISGRHAEFIVGGSGVKVTDLGSTNGTYVNGGRVSSSDLVDGDGVRLGRSNFKFKSMK
jgi:pSer/pThr/pTyr-binding forkhead associated (FHA) protein